MDQRLTSWKTYSPPQQHHTFRNLQLFTCVRNEYPDHASRLPDNRPEAGTTDGKPLRNNSLPKVLQSCATRVCLENLESAEKYSLMQYVLSEVLVEENYDSLTPKMLNDRANRSTGRRGYSGRKVRVRRGEMKSTHNGFRSSIV